MRSRTGLLALFTLIASVLVPSAEAARSPAAPTPAAAGYWLVAADGGVFSFGGAPFYGSTSGVRLNRPVVGMAATPTGLGYWLAAADGGIFAFGDARFFGSTGSLELQRPVVGMAATPSGLGYWLVAADGGIFAFGDAGFFGSAGGRTAGAPVVGMAATPTGLGYWLVGSDGAVYGFGDASAEPGSAAGTRLAAPIVGLAPTPNARGYWLGAADGGVFSFGDAPFAGSAGAHPVAPVVALAAAPRGAGYWLVAADGGVFSFGDAPFGGSLGGVHLAQPIVGVAARPVVPPPTVGIFFYPWYANPSHDGVWRHWDQYGRVPPGDAGSTHFPTRGLYSSADRDVLRAQAEEMAAAGIDHVISSWWGRGSWEDRHLPVVAEAVKDAGLELVIHLENYPGRSPAAVGADLVHLMRYGVRTVYLYHLFSTSPGVPPAEWATVFAAFPEVTFYAHTGTPDLVSGEFPDYAAAAGFDGVYIYDAIFATPADLARTCAEAHRRRLACAPSVVPAWDAHRATTNTRIIDGRAGARYDEMWAGALAASPDVVTITSYNEWHEGTQIEPAVPHCFPDGFCSPGYEGLYGKTGTAAQTAYLDRTREWTDHFRASRRP